MNSSNAKNTQVIPVATSESSQIELVAIAKWLGENRFAERAADYDRDAKFPTRNYQDLHDAGFLALTIPAEYGGIGADFETYCMVSAELGKWCGATALTLNMHAQTMFWTGAMFNDLTVADDARAIVSGHEGCSHR